MIAILKASCVAMACWAALAGPAVAKTPTTDAGIRQAIIRQSIAEYPGNCACPYNTASNGSRCGRRSAYDRQGGYGPMCFASDISASEVRSWRTSHGLAASSTPSKRHKRKRRHG